MEFKEYMHIERFGNDEVQGIELGTCYLFPKLDGTNASVWLSDNQVQAGSRKRHLSLESDNAGFYAAVVDDEKIKSFLGEYPTLRLFGEWLVPHSFKDYRDDAWQKFYVFDVEQDGEYLPYGVYEPMLIKHGIEYIPAMSVVSNATYDGLLKALDNNVFLVKDGKGAGEGIVIKNYSFQNKFGRTKWAKLITNSFKEKHIRAMGPQVADHKKMVEQDIVDTFVSKHLVDKVYAKIVNEMEGWNSRYIPRLLSTVFYDLINEEMWEAVKKFKNPVVNFKTLNTLSILRIKELRPELF